MRYRITAIQDEGLPEAHHDARRWLEDWLNKSLAGADFGCSEAVIMIVVFCTVSLPKAPPVSRLTTDGAGSPILALHVQLNPDLVEGTEPEGQLGLLCSHILSGLPRRPLRKPKRLEYERLHNALEACVRPFAQSAA